MWNTVSAKYYSYLQYLNDIFGYLSGDLNLELKAGRSMLSFRIQGKHLYVSIVATEKERKEREVTAKRKREK